MKKLILVAIAVLLTVACSYEERTYTQVASDIATRAALVESKQAYVDSLLLNCNETELKINLDALRLKHAIAFYNSKIDKERKYARKYDRGEGAQRQMRRGEMNLYKKANETAATRVNKLIKISKARIAKKG